MEKPSNNKTSPHCQDALKKRWAKLWELVPPRPDELDRVEAEARAMLEWMPQAVQQEWARLMAFQDAIDVQPSDRYRFAAIREEYSENVTDREVERHLADIVREREAS